MDHKSREETLRSREAVKVALSALLGVTADTQCKVSVKTPDGWSYETERQNHRLYIARASFPVNDGQGGLYLASGYGADLDEALAALWVD